MLRALVFATLIFVIPSATGQAPSVLHIKVVLVDAEGQPSPVPRHALLISENPASATPRRILTGPDGTADVRLRPGNYTVESDQPVTFNGKAYEWMQMLDIVAGRDAHLELTTGNAEVVPVPAASDEPRERRLKPTPRSSCRNGRTASSRSGRRPPARRGSSLVWMGTQRG